MYKIFPRISLSTRNICSPNFSSTGSLTRKHVGLVAIIYHFVSFVIERRTRKQLYERRGRIACHTTFGSMMTARDQHYRGACTNRGNEFFVSHVIIDDDVGPLGITDVFGAFRSAGNHDNIVQFCIAVDFLKKKFWKRFERCKKMLYWEQFARISKIIWNFWKLLKSSKTRTSID